MSDEAAAAAAMAVATAAHQAGRLDEAEALYRGLLESDGAQPEVLHRLGRLAMARAASTRRSACSAGS